VKVFARTRTDACARTHAQNADWPTDQKKAHTQGRSGAPFRSVPSHSQRLTALFRPELDRLLEDRVRMVPHQQQQRLLKSVACARPSAQFSIPLPQRDRIRKFSFPLIRNSNSEVSAKG
jgi:hypothetical protein